MYLAHHELESAFLFIFKIIIIGIVIVIVVVIVIVISIVIVIVLIPQRFCAAGHIRRAVLSSSHEMAR